MASRRLIIAMFTASALTAAAGVAYAANNTAHPSRAPGGPRPYFFGPGPAGLGPLGGVEHGEFVVAKPGGGSQTEEIQNGTATAVTSTSITVKSADGYTHAYAIGAATHQFTGCPNTKLAQGGDEVSVIALVQGSTDTAQSISSRVAFTRPQAGAPQSPRANNAGPTNSGPPNARPPGGFCRGGFGPGTRGFRGRFGPGGPQQIRPSGASRPPSGFPTGTPSFSF